MVYYILAIFAIIAICSCAFLTSVRWRPRNSARGNNGRTGVPAPQGSLHNGGASEALIRSLPVEVFKSQRSPESADAGGSGAGLEMRLLNNEHASESPKNGAHAGTNTTGTAGTGQQSKNFVEDEEEEQCPICFDPYCDNDQLRVLPCMHRFHVECVDVWLVKNKSCPLCKHEIDKPCENQSKAFMAARDSLFSVNTDKSAQMDVEAGGAGLGSEHKEQGKGLGSDSKEALAEGEVGMGTRRSRVAVAPSPREAGNSPNANGNRVWTPSRHGVSVPSEAGTPLHSSPREMTVNANE